MYSFEVFRFTRNVFHVHDYICNDLAHLRSKKIVEPSLRFYWTIIVLGIIWWKTDSIIRTSDFFIPNYRNGTQWCESIYSNSHKNSEWNKLYFWKRSETSRDFKHFEYTMPVLWYHPRTGPATRSCYQASNLISYSGTWSRVRKFAIPWSLYVQ